MRTSYLKHLRCLSFALLLMATGVCRALGVATCTVSATGVTFPPYSPTGGSSVTGTGNVAVTCLSVQAGTAAYTIALSSGAGTFANRTMASPGPPSYTLGYNLYSDNARTMVWGDGTSGTSTVSDSYSILLLPITHNFTVYGYIPSSQISAGVGTYSDSVTVTITF
jgi:spore coat protein U-like protein